MSYILDALKKADRERTLGKVPDLETTDWPARQQSPSQLWMWILGALLVINGLFVSLALLDRTNTESLSQADVARAPSLSPQEAPPVAPIARPPVESVMPEMSRPRIPVSPPVQQTAKPAVAAPPATQIPPPTSTRKSPATTGEEYDLPEWRELSLDFRSRLSLPRIDVHVYADDPARRFIMADLKKYREGETLANGALLERIHPGSIQLNYEGTRFRVER